MSQSGQAREDLNWLHAGVYNDPQGNKQQIYYAFESRPVKTVTYQTNPFRIVYAADNTGTMLGNRNVGQIKRNLITWDEHLQEDWGQYLRSDGGWQYGYTTRGRIQQRKTLLEKFNDADFDDPFPDGNQFLNIGPSINAIHAPGDDADNREEEQETPEARFPVRGPTYPNTQIPQDFTHIKVSAYREWKLSSLRVVKDFLNGKMAAKRGSNFPRYEDLQVDRVESAFYDLGWRVDRRAVWSANREVGHNLVRRAIDSQAWKNNPPLRYDLYKGEEVERLMNDLKRREDGISDEEDDESDGDNYGGGGGGGGAPGDGDESDEFSDGGDDDGNPLFVSDNRPRKRHGGKSKNAQKKGKAVSRKGKKDKKREKRKKGRGERARKKVKQAKKTNVDHILDDNSEADIDGAEPGPSREQRAVSEGFNQADNLHHGSNGTKRMPITIDDDSDMDVDYDQIQLEDLYDDMDENGPDDVDDEGGLGEADSNPPQNPATSFAGLLGLREMHLQHSNTPLIKPSSSHAESVRASPAPSLDQMPVPAEIGTPINSGPANLSKRSASETFNEPIDEVEPSSKRARSEEPKPPIKHEVPADIDIDLDADREPLHGTGINSDPFIIE
ncbi:uncharacterized protein BP5553_10175 [Venustampulla echinocandica]|uniref:Uncharacterized protein n=1 Tax=Venustampulla echinocandica TaxID=2656787 RepID=A0A370TAL4_9HELO|nr:uncharacterized protein BP5553_10175 [Venustampulla echinocandica]RDL30830.1 hypothetical protein BP5553_10175 [Venustampulla echinocandica]